MIGDNNLSLGDLVGNTEESDFRDSSLGDLFSFLSFVSFILESIWIGGCMGTNDGELDEDKLEGRIGSFGGITCPTLDV